MDRRIKIIECPRDAMQGIKIFIPTDLKVKYIQSLLRVGFDTLDFGSFVSPKAIPQMRDTKAVLDKLDLSSTNTKLLSIVANLRGAEMACSINSIDYLGFPFSISENFQMRNTHKTISESEIVLKDILDITQKKNKKLVVYMSMAFGNPYGDPWDVDIVGEWSDRLHSMGVEILSLSDTIGSSKPESISYLFSNLIPKFPHVEFGAHLHTHPNSWYEKLNAAYKAGCYRFDGAIQGFGGCPMASDSLTGNMPTEKIISYFNSENIDTQIDVLPFESAHNSASKLFSSFS
ncbi:MAG: hydroxymethylglutaryl-CoA lyase [Flavobacteriaceae bacterium]|jgi:hydroxymethylglutaryl-CoA lyase